MTDMLTIRTDGGRTWFRPGEVIEGEVSWLLDTDADALEVRLFWYTSGKGTRDVEIVDSSRPSVPGQNGNRSFCLQAPDGPYSFSGKLITLAWALELVVEPGGASERLDLVIGPRPVEVQLGRPDDF